MAHDVDVLVPPERFVDAMDTLFDAGWTASSGESRLCLRRMAQGIRAMNFFRDRFGDVDLHQWAYGGGIPHDSLQRALWDNAQSCRIFWRTSARALRDRSRVCDCQQWARCSCPQRLARRLLAVGDTATGVGSAACDAP